MQATYKTSTKTCYPMSAASSNEDSKAGAANSDWTSVKCFDIPLGTCKVLKDVRSRYKYNGISTSGATYGQGGLTAEQCEAACAADSACMQAVFRGSTGACYPMSAASSQEDSKVGSFTDKWTSVQCNH